MTIISNNYINKYFFNSYNENKSYKFFILVISYKNTNNNYIIYLSPITTIKIPLFVLFLFILFIIIKDEKIMAFKIYQ